MEEGRKEDEKKKKDFVSKLSVSEILSERNTARMEWKNKKFGERGGGDGMERNSIACCPRQLQSHGWANYWLGTVNS